ncbi:hypothetical protein RRG08_019373 [Elysia crispata]|uniref:Uncharacterized protein n=1 Tax=Elysia crispata TaxID=231223 RepID=A0AAE1AW08_9GAST|nr:hypothetical protein RRG08_019373 [Elysia crispata]
MSLMYVEQFSPYSKCGVRFAHGPRDTKRMNYMAAENRTIAVLHYFSCSDLNCCDEAAEPSIPRVLRGDWVRTRTRRPV